MQSAATIQRTADVNGSVPRRTDVLICGGGIGGLALAAWLRRGGIEAEVLERRERPGGVIDSIERDGFLFERGPNTILDKHPSLEELIDWAGLSEETIRIPMRGQTRHVWLGGRLHPVPTTSLAAIMSRLLPISGKLAILREPFIKAQVEREESVEAFVTRRLGGAWLRNLITPMVTGIWAGDPAQLCVDHAFPIMKELEREGGSLLRGALRRMKRKRSEARAAGNAERIGKQLVSFRGGLRRLPEALARRLGEHCRLATGVTAIEPPAGGEGFRVAARHDETVTIWNTRRLVIAAEAEHAAELSAAFDGELAALFRSIPYSRLAVVSLGLRADQARLPEGFGFLVPRGEGLRILGAIIHSNFLPGRAPAGCAALSVFAGGELDPAALELADDELVGAVLRDLGRAIDIKGRPVVSHLERWERAIPQYDMRHSERLRQFAAAEARWPGLHLAGNWRGGVSVGDRIESMRGLAQNISQSVNTR